MRKIIVERNKLKSSKDNLKNSIDDLIEELVKANKKNPNEILIFEKWNSLYQELFRKIYSQAHETGISSEDYMPVIDGNPMNKISSESMKLVAQLAYILSLFGLQDVLEKEKINNVGFVIFDSPKDKDLDIDKYSKFLKSLSEIQGGQIFLTGSDKEHEKYEQIFDQACFLPFLSENEKLLKHD